METTIGVRDQDAPSMRVWDFSDRAAVMIVATALRRAWHVDPESLVLDTAEATGGTSSKSDTPAELIRQVAQSLAQLPETERWDDDLWLSKTHYALLSPPELSATEEGQERSKTLLSTQLRCEIYEMFNHVFWDAYNTLKDDTNEVIGEFEPPSTSIMILDEATTFKTCRFDTDTFVYPIWISPGTNLTFSTDENEMTYGSKRQHWTFTLWVRAGQRVIITPDAQSSETPQPWSAVLALGLCKPRPLPRLKDNTIGATRLEHGRPWLNDEDDKNVEPNTPESWPEAVHLARAIFLKAGHAVDTCTFDDMDVGSVEEEEEPATVEENLEKDTPTSDGLYFPLSEQLDIRLLIIEPADSFDQELRTRLEVINLDSSTEYEAISYSWGHPSDKVSLTCNDASVMIPRNLEDVLKRLRRPQQPRRVWADSVCINQDDIPERGQQVSIMRHIYQRAKRVVAWLGADEQDQARQAFSAVCAIVHIWRPEGDRKAFSSYNTLLEPMEDEQISRVHRAVPPTAWGALRSLFENTYFRRFWIIQELALGHSAVVLWGEHHISWGLVGTCAAWAMTSGWHHGYSHQPLKSAFNAFLIYVLPLAQKSGISMFSRLDFSALLGMTMGFFDSTDARDRIYALLGIVFAGNSPDAAELILQPDYSQSLSQVYIHAARRILEHDQHLRMLSAVQHGDEIDTSYPSWVPRWDQPLHAEPFALQSEQGFYANGGELFIPSEESFSPDGRTLNLKGLLCDTVTEVTDVFRKGDIGFHALKTNQSHIKSMEKLIHYLNQEGRQLRASWSATLELFTLFGFNDPAFQAEILAGGKMRQAVITSNPGKYGQRKKTDMLGTERAQNDHLAEFLLYWRERASWETEALRHPSMQPFWNLMDQQTTYIQERATCVFNTFAGRRMFFLEDGTPGIGPAAMRPGDVIAILFGGIVPYVLRPLPDADMEDDEQLSNESSRWQLVGECFMPHLMQGEAIEQAGLLAGQEHYREDEYFLKLMPGKGENGEADPRFERKVGEDNVCLFRIC